MSNTYTFELTPEDLDTIAAALSNLPYKVANPIIEKIRAQFTATMQERAAAATEEVKSE